MSSTHTASNTTARTQFLEVNGRSYAYRRFGSGVALPLLFLQHFTGTLDNWDPAVTDPIASGREVILFDNAGVGRSTGAVPDTIAGMGEHPMAFLDALGIGQCDVVGYSLGFPHKHAVSPTGSIDSVGVKDPSPPAYSVRSGDPLAFVGDVRVLVNGVDQTNDILGQLADANSTDWPPGRKLGDGSSQTSFGAL